jgi:hypothetical protein
MKQTENEDLLQHLSELNDGDFVFIINEEGDLKSLLIPEDCYLENNRLPSNLQKILKIFGIKKIHHNTLH